MLPRHMRPASHGCTGFHMLIHLLPDWASRFDDTPVTVVHKRSETTMDKEILLFRDNSSQPSLVEIAFDRSKDRQRGRLPAHSVRFQC